MDPWSKEDYSHIIREASMVVENVPVVILPSGRVPGRVLLALPILEARWRNRYEIAKKGSRLEGFGTSVKYRPKGDVWGHLGGPGAPPARLGGGLRHQGAWGPGGSPPALLRGPGRFRNADFFIFFPEFFWQFS